MPRAHGAVGDLYGIDRLAPRSAAVFRAGEGERLVIARIVVRALVGEGDGDAAAGVDVDVRLPYRAEFAEVLLYGRPALDDGRAELPRSAVIEADVEGEFGGREIQRHRIAGEDNSSRGEIAAGHGKLENVRLETDAEPVLRVFHRRKAFPCDAAVAAAHDGHDGRLLHRGMIEGGEQEPVQFSRMVQLDDARIQHARGVGVHLFVYGREYDAHVLANDFQSHFLSPFCIFIASIAHFLPDFNRKSKIIGAKDKKTAAKAAVTDQICFTKVFLRLTMRRSRVLHWLCTARLPTSSGLDSTCSMPSSMMWLMMRAIMTALTPSF